MSIWFKRPSLAELHEAHEGTLPGMMGIEFTEVTDDSLSARMPVDHRTVQPLGIVHGGASVVLAETLGSSAGFHVLDPEKSICVGLEVNANHLRSVHRGTGDVVGIAKPIHLGGSTQVWDIRLTDSKGRLTCVCRLTLAVIASPFGAALPPRG